MSSVLVLEHDAMMNLQLPLLNKHRHSINISLRSTIKFRVVYVVMITKGFEEGNTFYAYILTNAMNIAFQK